MADRLTTQLLLAIALIAPLSACDFPVEPPPESGDPDTGAPSGDAPAISQFSVVAEQSGGSPPVVDTQSHDRFDIEFLADSDTGFRMEAHLTHRGASADEGLALFDAPCGTQSGSRCQRSANSLRCRIERDSGRVTFRCHPDTVHEIAADANDYFAATQGLPADYEIELRLCGQDNACTADRAAVRFQ